MTQRKVAFPSLGRPTGDVGYLDVYALFDCIQFKLIALCFQNADLGLMCDFCLGFILV